MQIIKYAFFGGFGVLTDIIFYFLLVSNEVNYQLANFVGYFAGTLISFFLNRSYTFKVKDKVIQRIIKFFLVAFLGYICSTGVLYILIELIELDKMLSKLITLFFVLIIQFTLNKKITFKQ